MVCVLSHGEMGILYAADHAYKPDRLWSHFSAEKCRTLAGKPKLFFIQACQGDQLDGGVHLRKVARFENGVINPIKALFVAVEEGLRLIPRL